MTRRLLLFLALLAVLLHGCNDVPVYTSEDDQLLPAPSGAGLVERRSSPIPDVPMPVGFVMVEWRSRSSGLANGGRYVEHYYQGRATKGDTLQFYRQALPTRQWQFQSQQDVGGVFTLEYIKGREALTMRVSKPRNVTNVSILIRDRAAQGPPPPQRPPLPGAPGDGVRPSAPPPAPIPPYGGSAGRPVVP